MVTISEIDVNMGRAGEIAFEGYRLPKIDGLWVMGYSVDRAQAYGEPSAPKDSEIVFWSLSTEQLGLLLACAHERRLASEVALEADTTEGNARRLGGRLVEDGLNFAEAGAVLSQHAGGHVDPAEAAAVLAAVRPKLERSLGVPEATTQAALAIFRIAEARRRALVG
jgi:hypothetical protein